MKSTLTIILISLSLLLTGLSQNVMAQMTRVWRIISLDQPGLYLASATLQYKDGDELTADFRVYCPTSRIRPTHYILRDFKGRIKKQGRWWNPAFLPQYPSEHELISIVCRNR